MPKSVLERLGLTPDEEEHEADVRVLKSLGLQPEPDDHPATAPKSDPYNLGDPAARMATPAAPPRSTLHDIHETLAPANVIPRVASDIGGNVADYARSGVGMVTQGVSDIFKTDDQGKYAGQPATGAGRVALGAAGTALSPLTGAVKSGENALSGITGNPDFADKAALMVPFPVQRAGGAVAHAVAPSTRAADEAIRMAGPDAPEMIRRMQGNPRLRAVDVSDPLRVGAQGLVDPAQPNAMSAVVNSAKRSAAEAKTAVKGAFDTALGPAPNIVAEYERLQHAAQTVGTSKIQPALAAAKPVDIGPVVRNIDDVLKPGVQAVANPGTQITPTALQQRLAELKTDLTDGRSVLTDPGRLHQVQSDLRREADELMGSTVGAEKRLGRQLKSVRNQLVDAIDASAPGYKKGLEEYRDAMDVQKSFDAGTKTLVNQAGVKGIETRPEYLERWVKDPKTSPEELAARRLGARDAIEQKMSAFQHAARRGTDIPEIDFNKQKMEILFGKEQTEQLFKRLKDERDIALSNQRILHNSKTAETIAAREHLKPREITPPTTSLPSWATGAGLVSGALTQSPTIGAAVGGGMLGLSALKSGAQYLGRRSDLSRNSSFANLVTASGPEQQAALAQLVAALDRSSRRNKLNNLLAPP